MSVLFLPLWRFCCLGIKLLWVRVLPVMLRIIFPLYLSFTFSTTNNSASEERFVLNFCFYDAVYVAPFLISRWTEFVLSTHHFGLLSCSIVSVNFLCLLCFTLLLLIYSVINVCLFSSYAKTSMAVGIPCLVHLIRYRSFASR